MAISRSHPLMQGRQADELLPPALRVLRPEDDARQRREMVWTLGLTGLAGLPAITEALRDKDVEVRREAVWALGRIGSPAVVPALKEALRDRDPEVRGLAGDVLQALTRALPRGS
jgi:HEAT repeat protein